MANIKITTGQTGSSIIPFDPQSGYDATQSNILISQDMAANIASSLINYSYPDSERTDSNSIHTKNDKRYYFIPEGGIIQNDWDRDYQNSSIEDLKQTCRNHGISHYELLKEWTIHIKVAARINKSNKLKTVDVNTFTMIPNMFTTKTGEQQIQFYLNAYYNTHKMITLREDLYLAPPPSMKGKDWLIQAYSFGYDILPRVLSEGSTKKFEWDNNHLDIISKGQLTLKHVSSVYSHPASRTNSVNMLNTINSMFSNEASIRIGGKITALNFASNQNFSVAARYEDREWKFKVPSISKKPDSKYDMIPYDEIGYYLGRVTSIKYKRKELDINKNDLYDPTFFEDKPYSIHDLVFTVDDKDCTELELTKRYVVDSNSKNGVKKIDKSLYSLVIEQVERKGGQVDLKFTLKMNLEAFIKHDNTATLKYVKNPINSNKKPRVVDFNISNMIDLTSRNAISNLSVDIAHAHYHYMQDFMMEVLKEHTKILYLLNILNFGIIDFVNTNMNDESFEEFLTRNNITISKSAKIVLKDWLHLCAKALKGELMGQDLSKAMKLNSSKTQAETMNILLEDKSERTKKAAIKELKDIGIDVTLDPFTCQAMIFNALGSFLSIEDWNSVYMDEDIKKSKKNDRTAVRMLKENARELTDIINGIGENTDGFDPRKTLFGKH